MTMSWIDRLASFFGFHKPLPEILPEPSVLHFQTSTGFPDWSALIEADKLLWNARKNAPRKRPKVLIATNVGGHGPVCVVESMLAAALALRGADVHVLLCDAALPGCLQAQIGLVKDPSVLAEYRLPEALCGRCQAQGEEVFSPLQTSMHRLGEQITAEERAEARRMANECPASTIKEMRFLDMAVGEHALAGALRYFARGDLSAEPMGEVVLRRYLEASLITAFAMKRLLDTHEIDVACFHHGLYVPQGIVGEACRSRGVRVVNWVVAYRQNTLIFSHDDTYHHTLMSEPTDSWREMSFTQAQEDDIVSYLKSRWDGSRDWIYFHEQPSEDMAAFAGEVGLDLSKPCIGLLTNVMWDAQLHYPANAFPDMLDWVLRSIAYFEKRPDLQLLIRVHPAEVRGTLPSRQPLVQEIGRAFPALPKNVFLIAPENPVSTYAAMELCDAVIIYGTKTGVELTSIGIPVIVAGEAWIRNKGLTYDASSPEHYFHILDRLPFGAPMPPEQVKMARRYAYHFFFRRMLPVPFMQPNKKKSGFDLAISGLADLMPGHFPGLDVICEGILTGSPFIYAADRLGLHDAPQPAPKGK